VTHYVHGTSELLGVQIDAAINGGNSGGPVLNEDGECVGIAFQSLKDGDAENVGFIIPTPVIAHFLADFARNGAFTGFPAVGFEWQPLEAPALRASLGMGPKHKGVLVTRVEPTAPGAAALRRGDVLMAFNGAPISCDGTVPFRAGERIAFGHLVAQRFVGETARLGLLRDGQPVRFLLSLFVLFSPHSLTPLTWHLAAGGERGAGHAHGAHSALLRGQRPAVPYRCRPRVHPSWGALFESGVWGGL
jgi:S1-C subfamily serine protease